jgi:hypothetical protein
VQLLDEKLTDASTVEFLQTKCNWAQGGTPRKLGAVALSFINSNAPGDYSSTMQVLAATHGVSMSLATYQEGEWSFKSYLAGPDEELANAKKFFFIQIDASFHNAGVSSFLTAREQL